MDNENSSEPTPAAKAKGAMNPMMIGGVIVAAIAIIAGLYFFMGMGKSTVDDAMAPTVNNTTNETSTESTDGAASSDVVEVTMEGGNFYFKPNVINAKLGQTVRVTLNSVSMQHDFVIDELGVKGAITPAGQTDTIEFVATEVGSFEFYCSVGNHKAQGMVGTLNVTQ